MSDLQAQLKKARENWVKAAKKNSEAEMKMWQKYGEMIKREIAKRMGKPEELDLLKIFDGKEIK